MDPQFWLKLQAEYDVRIAQRELLPNIKARIRFIKVSGV
ncbi:plasmid maintenance system antidote protein VapI [Herbaspirillum frisingense]|uniref:Plasmid maintenance system antidote protein VapI n=1 Tax=Herbaspirillum frisingense TaxID=92645 RepID=A0ABU1PK43_9BURK|nr:plasmid maintenance system antidote protein VapI [Herbaspirillum frisingense]